MEFKVKPMVATVASALALGLGSAHGAGTTGSNSSATDVKRSGASSVPTAAESQPGGAYAGSVQQAGSGAADQWRTVGGPDSSAINAGHQAGGIRNENAEIGELAGVGAWLRQHDAQRRPLRTGR